MPTVNNSLTVANAQSTVKEERWDLLMKLVQYGLH